MLYLGMRNLTLVFACLSMATFIPYSHSGSELIHCSIIATASVWITVRPKRGIMKLESFVFIV